MKRKIIEKLLEWKKSIGRKPLILHGARQVGKSWSLLEFGKLYYKDVIYINFETNLRLCKEFDSDISPKFLINRMELFFEKRINPEETLIIFDEVQVCERALTSLKYFCEDAPNYHVVAAGSLLGVAVNREKYSFPVGKVDLMHLYPLDFEEFLWANKRDMLADEITECFNSIKPMGEAMHQMALELYKTYLIVGGMPAAVTEYLKESRMIDAARVQSLILDTYVADMAKYASPSDVTKTLACFNSLPSQLAKDNRKFQYKVIQKGGSASLFGVSIDWLSSAGVIAKCMKITEGRPPIAVYQDLSSFKVYMSDVGLLAVKSGVVPHDILGGGNIFVGAITENYVANALLSNSFNLYYWASDSQAEVDFVIQDYDRAIPIEVKANLHVKSRSLSVFMQKYKPEFGIRVSAKNFGFEGGVKSVPLYAVYCIKPRIIER